MTTPESWIDLPTAKEHLNLDAGSNRHDVELGKFIKRAEGAIVRRVGHVKLATTPAVEYGDGGRASVHLDNAPLGVVDSVTVQGVTVPESDRDAGAGGWYLGEEPDRRAGLLRHTTSFPIGFVKVTHRPGRVEVPADLDMAALEMLVHLWETQRGSTAGRPGPRGEDRGDSEGRSRLGVGFALPNRVSELIAPFRLPAAG